jgi:mono/diheme cytochrome c family protein
MRRITPLALVLCLHIEACRDSNAQEARTQSAQAQAPAAAQARDTGRFVSHVDHVQPGGVPVPRGMVLRNPYEGSATAVATGAKLYVAYNCVDCHGADGSGAMASAERWCEPRRSRRRSAW